MKSILRFLGSHPTDIPSDENITNPLSPCPKTPNCIRISREIPVPAKHCFNACAKALAHLNPEQLIYHSENLRIESVFKVFLFRDDFTIKITENNSGTCYLHIRSASRMGYSDLGMNTRRVKQFLNHLNNCL